MITLVQNNLPLLTDTLMESSGLALDLTNCTVQFILQGAGVNFTVAATIVDHLLGTIEYQLIPPQTAIPGSYLAQWRVTDGGGGVRSVPTDPFTLTITPGLPVPDVTQFNRLADLYDDVRAITGDFGKNVYQDSAIASVMRTQLRLGRVRLLDDDGGVQKQWTVGADGVSLSPPILNSDTQAYALLVYHSALTLVTPNLAGYSYRTRALSERFGEQRDFLAELKNILYELEDGGGIYANITGLRSSLFAMNGIFVWSYVQAQRSIDLSFK